MGRDADDNGHPDKTQQQKQDRANHYEKQDQDRQAEGNGKGGK